MNNELLNFYRGNAPDAAGRTIEDIWKFKHAQLESVHDYIQWLFPATKPSRFNPNAPLLDDETCAAFASDDDLKARLLKSLKLMLDFYGLQLVEAPVDSPDAEPTVKKAANYDERKANWQVPPMPGHLNHNLLRLTRIIEALNVLGLSDESKSLCNCLVRIAVDEINKEHPGRIPEKTLVLWSGAAGMFFGHPY